MNTPRTTYVYRSIREGNRVRRAYLGTLADPVVQTLTEFERLGKATTAAELRKVEHELEVVETTDGCLQLIESTIKRSVRNLKKRWRRAGETRIKRYKMAESQLTHEEYEALVSDAADGDMDALAELRQILKANPNLRDVLGDLNQHVRHCLTDLATSGAADIREALTQTITEKRCELLVGGDSIVEVMLVDQILSTMLDAAVCQFGFSQPHAKESLARRWERRLTRAQNRHQSAIRSLIEVRGMLERDSVSGEPQ